MKITDNVYAYQWTNMMENNCNTYVLEGDGLVLVDPGLSNQIHLINQARIHSVHKKSLPFLPSRDQAQAIMLYTKSAIEKLFMK